MRSFLSLVLTISLTWSAVAQTTAGMNQIPAGTEVEIELLESISSETLHAGQTVPFKIVRSIEANGTMLLAAGTTFAGTVTRANPAGHWGKAGAFDLKLEPVKLSDGVPVRMDFYRPAKVNARGEKTTQTLENALTLAYYFPLIPVALIGGARKGKPFTIRAGERYLVYVTGTESPVTEPANP
jgi:hypothetical protein